eukprot:EG_transcript_2107
MYTYHASPATKDWETLDMRGEIQYVQDYSNTKQLTAAFDNMNPNQSSKKQESLDHYIHSTLNSQPDNNYRGPHLSWPLEPAEVDNLVAHFAIQPDVPLHSSFQCRILMEAKAMFSRMPSVTHITSNSGSHQKLIVVGDLHGQLADLLTIFIENGFPSPTGPQYLFNGDFVDRGEYGVEVATVLLVYKLLYPQTVHLNRGNHETINMNITYGFIDEIEQKFGTTQPFALFAQLWDTLPMATVIDNSVIVLHGGLFRTNGITLHHLNSIPKKDNDLSSNAPDMVLMTDVLWSDPQEMPGRQPGVRGSGTIQFGPDVTQQFLRQNNLRLLIRSHQVPSTGRGYEVLQSGMCITVFSASNYCGTQGNHGGLVIFERPGQHRCTEFWAPPLQVLAREMERRKRHASQANLKLHMSAPPTNRAESERKAQQSVLSQLQEMITKRHSDLQWFFKGCLTDNQGCISLDDWRSGLSAVLQLNIDWAAHEQDLLKGSGHPAGRVDWRQFLSHYKVKVAERYKGWQDEMKADIHKRLAVADLSVSDYFRIFDENGDGNIDVWELQRGLSAGLGLELSRTQAEEMMVAMAGPGGKLDVLGFLESLQMEYKGKTQPEDVQEVIKAIEKTLAANSKNMLDVFKRLDRNGDGRLSLAEIQQFLSWLSRAYPEYAKFSDPSLPERVMRAFDDDNSGTVSLLEFLDNFKPSSKGYDTHVEALIQDVARALFDHKSSLKALFYRIDTNGDGHLSPSEFRDGLRTLATLDCKLSSEELDLVARHVDTDSDGQISWQEFLCAFGLDPEARERLNSQPQVAGLPLPAMGPLPPAISPRASSVKTVPSPTNSHGSPQRHGNVVPISLSQQHQPQHPSPASAQRVYMQSYRFTGTQPQVPGAFPPGTFPQ